MQFNTSVVEFFGLGCYMEIRLRAPVCHDVRACTIYEDRVEGVIAFAAKPQCERAMQKVNSVLLLPTAVNIL